MQEPRQTVHSEPKNVASMAEYRGKVDETGQQVTVRVPRRSKRKRGWRMHVAMVDFDVLTRLELTGSEMRVLNALVRHIPERGGTEARTWTSELAEEMGVSQQFISRTIKPLRDRRIVRTPARNVFEITPWLLYNGDFSSWNAEAEEWPEPIWRRDGADVYTGEVD